jgi:hypothetical protein
MMQSQITLEKAKELIADAVKRFPNRINPRSATSWDEACLYTGPRDTHCIAGQVMADLDLPLPPIDSLGNSSSFSDEILGPDHPFTEDAINYLRVAQYVFDGGPIAHFPKTKSRRWSAALNLLNKYEDEAYNLAV